MTSSLTEELEALEAIYCEHEEFKLHQLGDGQTTETILTVRVKSGESHCNTVDVTFTLKNDYPLCSPDFSLSSARISRTDTASLKSELKSYADTLIGQPMLLMLTLWTKEHLENLVVDKKDVKATDSDCCTHGILLLHVDHMRARVRYTKTVSHWAAELGLTGRLICHERLILILLEGTQDALKEYLFRHRTVAIDVDSKGRSCKERMMSVLTDAPVDTSVRRFADFTVVHLVRPEDVEVLFVNSGLAAEYETFLVPLMKRQ